MRRAVVTGVGCVSPLGQGVSALMQGLAGARSAVRLMESWGREYQGLQSRVAAPAELVDEKAIPRQFRRSMGRMSIFAAQAAREAVDDARLDMDGAEDRTRIGCVIGSTMGSSCSICEAFESLLPDKDISKLTSMKFFQCVSHTAAMNTAQYLNIRGAVLAPAAACASGLQAAGVAYDLIRLGRQDVVLCGGAEELHPTVTGSFDILYATSTHFHEHPERTPRPFDRDRDGLVCGEGSGVLVLEELEHARARGARVYGEITGFHTCGSGEHVSQSNKEAMALCMSEALKQAGVGPERIDYVGAHATATAQGDAAEAEAIRDLFGSRVPVSSLKGYLGHTLGASGAIEFIATLKMMEAGIVYPTLNLENVGPDCEGINHVMRPAEMPLTTVLKNSFAFGGINAALVCVRLP